MRTFVIGVTLGLVIAVASPTAAPQFSTARELRLAFNADGTVNLSARNVTVRDILAEWARQCQCHVVNAEQLTGGAIMLPIQFENATQSAVLESLLRQAAGYVLTPKRVGIQSASNYDTIFILATSNPVAGAYVPPPPTPASLLPTRGAPDDELPPVVPVPAPSAAPPRQGPAPSTATPFGSRSTSPFVSITPVAGSQAAPGMSTPGGVAPGTAPGMGTPGSVTPGTAPPPPPPPTPVPGTPTAPLPSGTAMPIVAVPPPGQ